MSNLGTALVGVAIGSAVPWPVKTVWRLMGFRSRAADRAERRAIAKADGEMERLLAEIARLTARHGDLEELVDLLRRELDKALVRGNASLTVARILLFAVDQEPTPSAAMIAARDQAREVIRAADVQMKRGN